MHSELLKRKLDILDSLIQKEFALRLLCTIVGTYFEKFYTSVKISVVELGYISILLPLYKTCIVNIASIFTLN